MGFVRDLFDELATDTGECAAMTALSHVVGKTHEPIDEIGAGRDQTLMP